MLVCSLEVNCIRFSLMEMSEFSSIVIPFKSLESVKSKIFQPFFGNPGTVDPRSHPWDERSIYLHENQIFTIKNQANDVGKYTSPMGWYGDGRIHFPSNRLFRGLPGSWDEHNHENTCVLGSKLPLFPYNRGWEKSTQVRRGLYTNYI